MTKTTESAMFAGYNRLFREGMNMLLGKRFNVLAHVESFVDALTAMRADKLKINLLIGGPGNNSSAEFAAISEISRQFPETKIVALAPQVSQEMLAGLVKNGVDGILSNDISVAALLYSIEIVMLGERIVPTILSSSTGIAAPVPSTPETSHLGDHLSSRESQILHCLVRGLPNKSIADHLGISEATIKVHMKMLLRKLLVSNRTQAAIWGIHHGFQNADDSGEAVLRPTSSMSASELMPPLLQA